MNPFVFGEAVGEEQFIDRKEELKNLVRDLTDGQKIFLIAPRRYGKTSLILEAGKKLAWKGTKVIYVDLFKTASIEQFVAAFSKSISGMRKLNFESAVRFIKDFISEEVKSFTEGLKELPLGKNPPQGSTNDTGCSAGSPGPIS